MSRILSRVIVTDDGCWLFTGAKAGGYGQVGWHEDGIPCHGRVHRIVFEALVGDIPEGMHLDHLCHDPRDCHPAVAAECQHRACCNPQHLRPATNRANVLRGGGFAARNAAKTRCPNGHPYDEANTYVAPDGWRQCRTCRSAHIRAFRNRRQMSA